MAFLHRADDSTAPLRVPEQEYDLSSSRVYSFSAIKAGAANPHETTRTKSANFGLLVRVRSCDFVVKSFSVKNE